MLHKKYFPPIAYFYSEIYTPFCLVNDRLTHGHSSLCRCRQSYRQIILVNSDRAYCTGFNLACPFASDKNVLSRRTIIGNECMG